MKNPISILLDTFKDIFRVLLVWGAWVSFYLGASVSVFPRLKYCTLWLLEKVGHSECQCSDPRRTHFGNISPGRLFFGTKPIH